MNCSYIWWAFLYVKRRKNGGKSRGAKKWRAFMLIPLSFCVGHFYRIRLSVVGGGMSYFPGFPQQIGKKNYVQITWY